MKETLHSGASGNQQQPGTRFSSILVLEPSKTRSFPIKTRVIWVPGTINGFGFDNINQKTPPQTTKEGHKMYTELLNARFSLTKL